MSQSTAISNLVGQRIDAQRSKLWQVHGILELAVESMRERFADEDSEPIVWTALSAAEGILKKAIQDLDVGVLEAAEEAGLVDTAVGRLNVVLARCRPDAATS